MPIDIPRVSIRDLDWLVASVPGPSLLYAANGTGGASSSLLTLVVSLPTVATNEVAEISLPPVASPLLVVSLPTIATETPLAVSTYGSNQPSCGNQPTSVSIPSSGSKSAHGSNRNSGSKSTYGSNRPQFATYNDRHHFWSGWNFFKWRTSIVDCLWQFNKNLRNWNSNRPRCRR